MVGLEGVCAEMPGAVLTRHQSFGAGVDLVGLEPVSLNFLTALVLTMHWLKATLGLVLVQDCSSEVLLAVLAGHQPLGARVQHVVLHHEPGDFGTALVQAGHGVFLTGVEVSFELAQRSIPFAAFVLKWKMKFMKFCCKMTSTF